MSIHARVLGDAGRDNAVALRIDARNAIHRLLFDCGEGCVTTLDLSDIQAIDHLFFSHLHMDHIAGFDSFFRATFNRETKPNVIWGPPDTATIIHHRFQGFLWNLRDRLVANWTINEVFPDHIASYHCTARDAFSSITYMGDTPYDQAILTTPYYTVIPMQMDHMTPSLAYIVRESPRYNVDMNKLAELNFAPGEWLRALKDVRGTHPPTIMVGDREYELAQLRTDLMVESPGESFAYLTDFLLDDTAQDRLASVMQNIGTIVCECTYRESDADLASRRHHMTPVQVATLARRVHANQLILFHVSNRYREAEWREMLVDARAVFPETIYPLHWGIE
jgi:ribonuclease Z